MRRYHKNPRKITRLEKERLTHWLTELGDLSGIVHDLNSDEIIGGNQRGDVFDINKCQIELVQQLDAPDAQGTIAHGFIVWQGARYAYRQVRWTPEQCERANIVANKAGGEWDIEILLAEFERSDLLQWGFDDGELDGLLAELGAGLDAGMGNEQGDAEPLVARQTLAERFVIPPFSVLDARQGYWQERKRAWLALGIQSELGRGGGGGTPPHPPTVTRNPDGSLNYGGTPGTAERLDRQRQPNATPGGSPLPAASLVNGKTVRGDGRGRPLKRGG